jgi:hypothetical protein
MQNNQEIIFRVVVDVDRKSPEYSREAVKALDPIRKGPSGGRDKTLKDADKSVSRDIALRAVRSLLIATLGPQYGGTTIRIQGPKNLKESLENDEEMFEERPDIVPYTFDKT